MNEQRMKSLNAFMNGYGLDPQRVKLHGTFEFSSEGTMPAQTRSEIIKFRVTPDMKAAADQLPSGVLADALRQCVIDTCAAHGIEATDENIGQGARTDQDVFKRPKD